jgi:hypothetical protein
MPLQTLIDQAFDFRGDVTLELTDGSEVTGYLFNRNHETRKIVPFVGHTFYEKVHALLMNCDPFEINAF